MRAIITDGRPDLLGAEADMGVPEPQAEAPVASADGGPAPSAAAAIVDIPAGLFESHAEARQALIACEVYFRTKEPSSAALLLITQSRLLIGMPLIDAMEILLPEQASRAIVSFGPQTGFALSIARLKALSGESPGSAPIPPDTQEAGPPPTVTNASEAAAVLRGVEEFFRRHERSSPVPMLLQRARTYLEKDFQALIDELIPKTPPQS
jgi:type VI secretion system protein ImpA